MKIFVLFNQFNIHITVWFLLFLYKGVDMV